MSRCSSTIVGVFLCCFALPSQAVICSEDSNQNIPQGIGSATPGAPASITIEMPASTATILDLDFQLAIDHTYVGDLIVTLTSPPPLSKTVTLIDRPGRPTPFGTFGCFRNNIDVTLDDDAAGLVEDQCAVADPTISGTHQPTGSLTDFNGDPVSGTWTLTVTDNAGDDLGTIISGNNCIDVSTTPVTISSFESKRTGRSLKTTWQTSSESFNLGFHLWGNVDGEWQQLNRRMIASNTIDSVVPQDYKHRVNLLKIDGELIEVGVSSVSTSGQEEFYGPFEIGERYGEDAVPRYVDWSHQRTLHDEAMNQAGYTKVRQRWVKNTPRREARFQRQAERFDDLIFEIGSSGMYRISYEDLLQYGIDLKGMPIHKLSLTRGGVAVPRAISTGKKWRRHRFGPGSEITFYAYGPSASDARYVATEPYRLSFDPSKVIHLRKSKPSSKTLKDDHVTLEQSHIFTTNFGDKNIYSFGLEGDGWYDSSIRAIRAVGVKSIDINVAEDAILEQAAVIELSLFGVTNFPQVDADGDGDLEPGHHYKVYLNRTDFPDAVAEGFGNGKEFIHVNQQVLSQLKHGPNELQIELIPDNGHGLDLVYLIDGSLSYARPNTMRENSLNFVESASDVSTLVQSNGFNVEAVFAVDRDQNVVARSFAKSDGLITLAKQTNASERGPLKLYIIAEEGYSKPAQIYKANSVSADELSLTDVDYVIIADASLRGGVLQRFVARQEELGRRTKVVSSQAIFDTYSSGNALPQAIADYLREQSLVSPFQYVLLVGGHTYNYRGYNTEESNRPINLIPSFYRGSDFITKQIPTAVPFVDFDQDGTPDRAIGRWPVRDQTQLELVVNKTLAWHADGSHKDSKTALFIADAKDEQNNFTQSSARLISSLGLDLNPWPAPGNVFLDSINIDSSVPQSDKLITARDSIVNGINQGPALTVYSGHGAPGVWGRQALVSGSVSDRFNNESSPTFIMPLACYTTYYETPEVKSLPELLLTDNTGGAVAISGASLLSRSGDNERFGRDLLKKMTLSAMDLGTAVMEVKREIHAISPRHQAVIYNWVTLGDPTLSFELPEVIPLPIVDQAKEGEATDQ